ncbi:MAG: tyrosinase family protein [Gammaproteobacteria bacterium]
MGVRKNAASLTASEKARFTAALRQVKANGRYDQYVRQHRDLFQSGIHGGAMFLPWHREFLRQLELDLQAVDSTVTIPYWDWTVDRSSGPPIWADDLMGGNGQAPTQRVTTGPYAFPGWVLNVTSPPLDPGPALRRRFGGNALPTRSQVDSVLALGSYASFRPDVEQFAHNTVHTFIGGSASASTSPNDPVFFLLHCNVDRLWSVWQTLHPTAAPYTGPSDPMLPVLPGAAGVTPASLVNHLALGYSYDEVTPQVIDLVVGAPPRSDAIGRAGEIDWYRFTVAAAGLYVIETVGPTDVFMSLFGPNSQAALVTEDDDNGQDRNARIVSALSAGTYFVRIRHFGTTGTGTYGISVRAGDAQPTLPEIQVNGPSVPGTIAAANESDLYRFAATAAGLYTVETAGITDTFLTLFGPDSQTRLIAQDDDSGPGFNSRIVADLAVGVYIARVRHFSPQGTGAYSIAVRR